MPNYYEPASEIQGKSEFATDLRQKLAGKRVVGYIGSIVNYEGLQHLVEALARRTAALGDVALLIVGDGPYLVELKELVATRESADNVKIHGTRPTSGRRRRLLTNRPLRFASARSPRRATCQSLKAY